jgi:hypothetical protein
MTKNKTTQTEINFIQIIVGSEESLSFHKDMFTALGYKIEESNPPDYMFYAYGDKMTFLVHHGANISGSGIWMVTAGASALFFRVDNKGIIDNFCKKVLEPRHIKPRLNTKGRKEEGKYGIFFDTQEKLKIGITC